nr:hypothetical protein CFP56_42176 [Quercus suber]
MRPIPLDQRGRARIMIDLQHLAMQMQPFIPQPMHMNRRDPHDMRTLALEHMSLGHRARRHTRRARTRRAQTDERTPPREQDGEAILPPAFARRAAAELLLIQQTGREFRALREPQQGDPGSAPGIRAPTRRERVFDLVDRGRVVDGRVLVGDPAQPASKGAPVRVHGDHAGPGRAEEGRIREDEPELWEVSDQRARLRAEDVGVHAPAVQAEDAREGEGGVFGGGDFGGGGHRGWFRLRGRDVDAYNTSRDAQPISSRTVENAQNDLSSICLVLSVHTFPLPYIATCGPVHQSQERDFCGDLHNYEYTCLFSGAKGIEGKGGVIVHDGSDIRPRPGAELQHRDRGRRHRWSDDGDRPVAAGRGRAGLRR